jgi:hypothetical protein
VTSAHIFSHNIDAGCSFVAFVMFELMTLLPWLECVQVGEALGTPLHSSIYHHRDN